MLPITVEDCIRFGIRQSLLVASFLSDSSIPLGQGCKLVPNLAGSETLFCLVGPQVVIAGFANTLAL